jgi:hypothetical protein
MSEQTKTEFETQVWDFIHHTLRAFIDASVSAEHIGGKEGVELKRFAAEWTALRTKEAKDVDA